MMIVQGQTAHFVVSLSTTLEGGVVRWPRSSSSCRALVKMERVHRAFMG
jgi:hypothetical protein